MKKDAKIYIAGHRGLVGSAMCKALRDQGYHNLIVRTHQELDLTNQEAVTTFFEKEKPEYVVLAAAKVGGIYANNTYPAEFIYQNLAIQNNVIHQAYLNGVKRLIFLGSSCIYPKECPQPIKEDYLLTGPLEPTNQPYALAKIAGIEMCASYNRQYGTEFLAVMPTNLYGPGDNYHPQNSHVIPALIKKIHDAKLSGAQTVNIWGTGNPRREFLHASDLADAICFLLNLNETTYKNIISSNKPPLVNVGTGEDLTIKDLAKLIAKVISFEGTFIFDSTKPDGTLRKVMDVSKINLLGWKSKTSLSDGLADTYNLFSKEQQATIAHVV